MMVPSAPASDSFNAVFAALHDDLNTPAALGALFKAIHSFGSDPASVATVGDYFAFKRVAIDAFGFLLAGLMPQRSLDVPSDIRALAEKRWAAKKVKDYATADALRKELAAAGWSMLDGKDGYKLEPLKKA